ncbi:MAG TPA: hypothetical protein VGS20_10615 [Candidatus Acidoferrales bacterium]|nr:hypothetical protein [Candidatus Acidoferrales bacterium]
MTTPRRRSWAGAMLAAGWFAACLLVSLFIMVWVEARGTRNCGTNPDAWLHPVRVCSPFGNWFNYDPGQYLAEWDLPVYPGSVLAALATDYAGLPAENDRETPAFLRVIHYRAASLPPDVLGWYRNHLPADFLEVRITGSRPELLIQHWVRRTLGTSPPNAVVLARIRGREATGLALAPGPGTSETSVWLFREVRASGEN